MGAFTAKGRPLPRTSMWHDTGQLGGAPTASLQGRSLDRRDVPAHQPPCKEQRILATWVFGEAWDCFSTAQYAHMRLSAFLVSGCGLPLTGENDHLVQVHGAPSEGLDIAHNDSRRLGGDAAST